MKRIITIGIASILLSAGVVEAQRRVVNLKDGWQFSKDGQTWEEVSIPHDWAIAGPFDKKWDMQTVAIEQNGEKVASEKTGRSGALPWLGKGTYKLTFEAPEAGHIGLRIDGAMSEPRVKVNGKEVGYWPYGYNAFEIDITSSVKKGAKNELQIDLQNVEESSRWYPGAGLYRPVHLIVTPATYLDDWQTYVRTNKLTANTAVVCVSSKVQGAQGALSADVEIAEPSGKIVGSKRVEVGKSGDIWANIEVANPKLWTPESPTLYVARLTLKQGETVVDRQEVKTGIRTVRVSKEKGFELNGESRKIQGVCLHHDLGPLGAAVNKSALIRQIAIMKDMGVDAIRTAHNMPSQMQMEVCDSMGMMVMAESFDMWLYAKCKNGYSRFFKEWAEKDITNLVRLNRNHPSIIMWSIGNEIPDQGNSAGLQWSVKLQDLCHVLDASRPVTQGLDRVDAAIKSGVATTMDVPGYNYRVHKYRSTIDKLPQGFLLGSETASTVSSRGVYKFPVEVSNQKTYEDGQCSSYDTEYCSWSNLPEDDFEAMDDLSYTIGQFVWTGFDYLGEPTPYDGYWPSRSSYFGICDLAGLPKDRYYLYRSQWNKRSHTIHLLPHWTWPGREGQTTPVYCYTDYPTAELFVNGVSQGKRTKDKESKMDRYRLRWNEVVYEPGELKVVVYDEKGEKAGQQVFYTAGGAKRIKMRPDKVRLRATGEDMAFVTVSLVDEDGVEVPTADDQLDFVVDGEATFEAVCNGDATSLEVFKKPTMKLFSGKLVVVVRSKAKAGKSTLTVTDKALGISQTLDFTVE